MIPVLSLFHIFTGSILAIVVTIQCKTKSKKRTSASSSPAATPIGTTVKPPTIPEAPPAPTSSMKQPEKGKTETPKKEETKSEVKDPDGKMAENGVSKKEKEKMEDTFDAMQPKKQDADRKKELGDNKKAENKGDYKTWNKIIENDEFNKSLSENEKKDKKKKKEEDKDEKKEGKKDDSDIKKDVKKNKGDKKKTEEEEKK